ASATLPRTKGLTPRGCVLMSLGPLSPTRVRPCGVVHQARGSGAPAGLPPRACPLGGFHLCGASPRRIAATVRDLKKFSPRYLIPSHCSGLEFEAALKAAFPRGFALDMVGTEYRFESP